MDYHILDVCNSIPKHQLYKPITGASCMTFVRFEDYLQDMYKGQENMKKARQQLQLDMPRCDFRVEGEKCSIYDNIPDILVRFCTQSVMCLPLELLMSDEYNIVDSKKAMSVDVWGNAVFISKEMKVIKMNGITIPFCIYIDVDTLDPFVCIRILFSKNVSLVT